MTCIINTVKHGRVRTSLYISLNIYNIKSRTYYVRSSITDEDYVAVLQFM